MTSLAPHMEAFLREHLVRHRGASPHTCDSYAYSFQSLFEFASKKLKVAPSALMLEQLGRSADLYIPGTSGDHTWQSGGDTKHPLGCLSVVLPVSAAPRASRSRSGAPCSGDPLQEDRHSAGALSDPGGNAGLARRS